MDACDVLGLVVRGREAAAAAQARPASWWPRDRREARLWAIGTGLAWTPSGRGRISLDHEDEDVYALVEKFDMLGRVVGGGATSGADLCSVVEHGGRLDASGRWWSLALVFHNDDGCGRAPTDDPLSGDNPCAWHVARLLAWPAERRLLVLHCDQYHRDAAAWADHVRAVVDALVEQFAVTLRADDVVIAVVIANTNGWSRSWLGGVATSAWVVVP